MHPHTEEIGTQMGKIKTLKTMVEIVLEKFPYTRNSDTALTTRVWKVFVPEMLMTHGDRKFIDIDRLHEVPKRRHRETNQSTDPESRLTLPSYNLGSGKETLNQCGGLENSNGNECSVNIVGQISQDI